MSGLPASGKSRLGAALAPLLGLELLDKDDFLEALYERDEIGDAAWRERLSRKSDELFRSAAMATGAAVLASYWRHPGRAAGGGGVFGGKYKFMSDKYLCRTGWLCGGADGVAGTGFAFGGGRWIMSADDQT